MSYERGLAAFNLQMPDEIPHTQYIEHPAWEQQLRDEMRRPAAGIAELLDFDFCWHTDMPDISRGRWTDMGHAAYMPEGSDYRLPTASPFNDPEEIYALDPFDEYGRLDVKRQAKQYQDWYDRAHKGD